jgi:hypothetical protein
VASRAPRARELVLIYANLCVWLTGPVASWLPVASRCVPAAFPLLPVASRAPRARELVLIFANFCVWTSGSVASWLPVASRCVPAAFPLRRGLSVP